MNSIDKTYYKKPAQKRSSKAVDDILESAKAMLNDGKVESLNVRTLSIKSGHSIGTIYRYFERFDNVFLELFTKKRREAILVLANVIDSHDANSDVRTLVTNLADIGIGAWSSKHPMILRLLVRLTFKDTKEPERFHMPLDGLIPLCLAVQKRDQTNTFRLMRAEEMALQIRALQLAIRSPFIEGDPIAGTEQHRQFVIEMGVNLLSKPRS